MSKATKATSDQNPNSSSGAPIEISQTSSSSNHLQNPEALNVNSQNSSAESNSNNSKPKKSAKSSHKSPKTKQPRTTKQKIFLILIIVIVLVLIGVLVWIFLQIDRKVHQDHINHVDFPDPIYSTMTGLEISDASLNTSPTFCVQIPNGNDGARPQAGLTEAAYVFEAIAESGITRFAAVFQNPTSSAIGPIRSLRPYYLDWDTPFDCTVVHAGGSDEAIAAISHGGQRNLDESNTYMWREFNTNRTWNNLFTSAADLQNFNRDHNYNTSEPKVLPRLTPDEVAQIQRLTSECSEGEACNPNYISNIAINFSASRTYNTVYTYNPDTNNYSRAYANGDPHLSYNCPAGLERPNTKTACGEPVQVTPSVVIAMIVSQSTMSDNYHQAIATIDSGNAVIFQNGTATEATWHKSSQASQLIFRDSSGNELKFTPGQIWIAAVPQYGSIEY